MQILKLPRLVLTYPRTPRSSWEARLRLIAQTRAVETGQQRARREATERMRSADLRLDPPSWLRPRRVGLLARIVQFIDRLRGS